MTPKDPFHSTIRNASALQSYQTILYSRALHPELFQLKGRRVVKHGDYELEAWLTQGGHILRYERGPLCACELVTAESKDLPQSGMVSSALCAGERDYEHHFERAGVTYMNTVQTETLSDNLFASTHKEMLEFAREGGGLLTQWDDESGQNLSLLDVQRYSTEIHAQAYHMIANGGVVIRTQTIFEHA